MTEILKYRRSLLRSGVYALAGGMGLLRAATTLRGTKPALVPEKGSKMSSEEIIRNYYSGWENKNWSVIESLLAAGFTFTSPNDDDHIDPRAFKTKCWPQADYIERFDLECLLEKENEAFAKYLCHTKNGKSLRNTEYFRFREGRIEAIEVYFGGHQSFPSAVSLREG